MLSRRCWTPSSVESLATWEHSGGVAAALGLNTVRDMEDHVGVTTLEYHVPVAGLQESATFPRSSNHQSQPGIEPGTPAPEAKVLTTRPRVVPYTSRAGTGICAPPHQHGLKSYHMTFS